MEENAPPQQENKPFSVLERFRQLKKENKHTSDSDGTDNLPTTSGTVFQTQASPKNSSERNFDKGAGVTIDKGKWHGKRRLNEYPTRSEKGLPADMHLSQQETDVGITEFIRDGPGFEVIIKHRYTDFQVNEIDLSGNVVRLTSTDFLKEEDEPVSLSEEEDPTLLSPEQWAALKEITEKELTSTVDVDVTKFDKDQRQRIHKAVKKRFGVRVYSNTKEVDDKKIIKIGYASGNANFRHCSWPKGRPEYLHFVMLKENSDMSEVLSVLGKYTRYKMNKFGYAGTKDKRAVTSQRMSLRRGECKRFSNCQKLRGIAVGNYAYKWENLRLGDLNGNRFKIVLRHIRESDAVIENAVEHLKKTGFINYFGLQRFGQSTLVPTYSVGKAILKGDWKLAVELILKPRPGEAGYRDIKEARDVWWETRCAETALKSLSRKDKTIEGKILLGLRKHGPNAYQNAMDTLPRYTVTLYLHSYQSLIWNKVVSRRIRQFGLKVLPGDLVKADTKFDDNTDETDEIGQDESGDDEEAGKVNVAEIGCSGKVGMRVLTAQEAETACIWDVMYPLPGDEIRLPDNEVGSWYHELLQEDGYTMDSFKIVNKKYGMSGCYRNMLERAEDISWHTVRYSSPDQDILLSDLDVLRGKSLPTLAPDGPYKALVIEFNLKVCSYATMALRELTKCDTSTSSQAMLTNQARQEDMAVKRQKLETDENPSQEMEAETVNENISSMSGVECIKNGMDSEEIIADKESQGQDDNSDCGVNERNEMNRRNAETDNIINKILDIPNGL